MCRGLEALLTDRSSVKKDSQDPGWGNREEKVPLSRDVGRILFG